MNRNPVFAVSLRILLLAGAVALLPAGSSRPDFIDAEGELLRRFGDDWAEEPLAVREHAIVAMAESLPLGGAIHLPESEECGLLDFRRIADDIQITGGNRGLIVLGGAPHGQSGIQILFSRLDQEIAPALLRPTEKRRLQPREEADDGTHLFDDKVRPATGLQAMFCEGSLKINADVRNCSWIAGANAFGARTVTASARVDDSLFLWFGINWPFADYNGHLEPKNRNRDWTANAQMHLDLKGGGKGTRCYLMVETNYGNPGPGVILENCKGLALYHGSTERASSQGPGVYWLKDCEGVQLGLRRIFSATREGPRSAMPSHDITVEGGRGNILQDIECFGNAQEQTMVNSDPELQVWSVSTDFENKGLEGPDIVKFAYTPGLNTPAGAELEALRPKLPALTEAKLKLLRLDASEERRAALERFFLSGRDAWNRHNACQETTLVAGGTDMTRPEVPAGTRLPPPPTLPATDAPRLRRPIEFTQQPQFGRELLDAGADPTGKTPSDDAFARLMFQKSRVELQAILEETYRADADFRRCREAKNEAGMKEARAHLDAAFGKLHPEDPRSQGKKGKPGRVKRHRIEIPSGTFLLTRPLVLTGGWHTLWGAGPDHSILKAAGDFKVLEQHGPGALCNFSVEGGRVGLAFTGADHNDPVSPTLQSYVAGSNLWNLTFRDQTFAGIHVGNDDPERMGGAEHDQNKYVDIRFIRTGRYGIFMNQNMLDKWLLLHCDFAGQTTAGVSIKFNNLIHGGVIGCSFKDIDGPGLDFMGGNPENRFRPHQVMLDQCDFVECGNASSPAVDQGAGVCMSFTRCNIVTRKKTVKTGYRGGAQIYQDVFVDAATENGAPALQLRAIRNNQNGRPNGHTLLRVRSTGSLAFINDANDHNALYQKTCLQRGIAGELDWDCNPAAHDLAPSNGWSHPFLFYDCEFGKRSLKYTLSNVDPGQGKVLREVDLSSFVR